MFKSPLNTSLTAIVAAIAVGAAGVPAMAKTGEAQTVMYPQQKDGEQVYCVKEAPRTGTHLRTKICQSRADWADEGLAIPEQGRASETAKKTASEG